MVSHGFFFAQQPSTDLLFILIETGKFSYSDCENFSRIRSHLMLLDSNINSKRTRWLYVTYTICDMKWGKLNQKEIKLKGDFVFRIFLQSTFFIRVSVEKSIQRIFLKSELPINHNFVLKTCLPSNSTNIPTQNKIFIGYKHLTTFLIFTAAYFPLQIIQLLKIHPKFNQTN